jgi:hypothetical protein
MPQSYKTTLRHPNLTHNMPCSYVRDRFFVAALKSDKVRNLFDIGFLRAGYHYGDKSQGLASFASLGAGVQFAGVELSAAWLTASPTLGNSLLFSLGYSFEIQSAGIKGSRPGFEIPADFNLQSRPTLCLAALEIENLGSDLLLTPLVVFQRQFSQQALGILRSRLHRYGPRRMLGGSRIQHRRMEFHGKKIGHQLRGELHGVRFEDIVLAQ